MFDYIVDSSFKERDSNGRECDGVIDRWSARNPEKKCTHQFGKKFEKPNRLLQKLFEDAERDATGQTRQWRPEPVKKPAR